MDTNLSVSRTLVGEARPPAPALREAALRVAIVHDWLTTYAGAERVLSEIIKIFPQADLFCLVDFLPPEERHKILGKTSSTSFIQNLPFARKKYRAYLPLMPAAIEQFDLSGYDLIISSSHAVAKGVLTGPDQKHVCYCHTPIRYAWDFQHQYLAQAGIGRGVRSLIARLTLHYVRMWDTRTSHGVDQFIANSNYIGRRIKKSYGRSAVTIYPPVDTEGFVPGYEKEDFYLAASRMVPYKRLDLIVQAFAAMPERRLIVIGDGPDMPKIRRLATPNISLLGYQSDAVLREHLQRARAFVFAAEEDFGILPVEAQACGTPVIAYGRGGALETVVDVDNAVQAPPTGVLFNEQSTAGIIAAVEKFEQAQFNPAACRAWAESFSTENFRAALRNEIFC